MSTIADELAEQYEFHRSEMARDLRKLADTVETPGGDVGVVDAIDIGRPSTPIGVHGIGWCNPDDLEVLGSIDGTVYSIAFAGSTDD